MRYRKVLSRRTMLRGAGTIAIGLPFLDEMATRSAFAALPEPPVRAFNVFHGLGFPTPLQGVANPFAEVLEPLSPIRDKLAILRGVDQVRCDEGGINAHFDGAAGAFTGEPPDGEARAGGPSLDQVLRDASYPGGQPSGVIPTVLMGTYFRRSRPARYIHSWNDDGTAADLPHETPVDLFSRFFGSAPVMPDPTLDRVQRLRQSVLDSVVEQYRFWMSDASNLSGESRAKIGRHLEKLREHEMRVFGSGPGGAACVSPGEPGASTIPHGGTADPNGQGIDITLDDLVGEWRLMADLYATAIQCDRVRFGSVTFQAAGERVRVTGTYDYQGRRIYQFDDASDLNASGDRGCSHEFWHRFNGQADVNSNREMRAHLHVMMNGINHFLEQLADSEYADENGLSILENSMVTVSTESGDGRHSDSRRELSGVFHAISGANERFRTGEILDVNAEGLDLYNTMLEAYGVSRRLGPSGRGFNRVDAILR